MTQPSRPIPRLIAIALCLALFSVLFGFGLGGAFGLLEDGIKVHLNGSGTAVLQSVYGGDVAAKDVVVAKSWDYLIRAHLHGGGIGAAALGSILALIVLSRQGVLAQVSAVAFGAGAVTYSVFWLSAGLLAPGLGSTGAAKEALQFIAIPGAGLSLVGVVGTLLSVFRDGFTQSPAGGVRQGS